MSGVSEQGKEKNLEYKLLENGPECDVWAMCDGIILMASRKKDPQTMLAAITLGGDRHLCCDEAVVAWDGDIPVGIATIAPKGESGEGEAEIVGLFVLDGHRRQGVGRELFTRAIARCRVRELGPVHVQLLSRAASELAKSLPPETLAGVEVVDMSHLTPF